MNEFNIIVETENFRESDILLFFGEENPPNLIRIPESFDMWDLLVELSLFPSKGQARKDGKWGKFLEIPNGWSEFSFGKKRIGVFVLKFV